MFPSLYFACVREKKQQQHQQQQQHRSITLPSSVMAFRNCRAMQCGRRSRHGVFPPPDDITQTLRLGGQVGMPVGLRQFGRWLTINKTNDKTAWGFFCPIVLNSWRHFMRFVDVRGVTVSVYGDENGHSLLSAFIYYPETSKPRHQRNPNVSRHCLGSNAAWNSGCVARGVKVGFHYPSSRPEFTGRVDGPRTRVHFLTPVNSGRELRVVETGRPCTRAVYTGVTGRNSGSGNRPLDTDGYTAVKATWRHGVEWLTFRSPPSVLWTRRRPR